MEERRRRIKGRKEKGRRVGRLGREGNRGG